MADKKKSLDRRLENCPELKARFELLLDAIEDRGGNFDLAGDIEQYLIDEMREIAKEAMSDWAVRKEKEKVEEFREDTDVKCHGKKSLVVYDIRQSRSDGKTVFGGRPTRSSVLPGRESPLPGVFFAFGTSDDRFRCGSILCQGIRQTRRALRNHNAGKQGENRHPKTCA